MIQQLQGHRGNVWCVAYSPDGKFLVSIGADQILKLWALDSGQECWSVATKELNHIAGLAFSPDSQRLAAPSDLQTLKVWDIKTRKELLALPTGPKHFGFCPAFSPDGNRLACSSYSTVKIWDARTGKELSSIPTSQPISRICFSPDGRRLAFADVSPIVHVWDVEEGRELKTLSGHNATVWGVAFRPDGHLLATSSEDRTIKLWDLQNGVEQNTFRGHTDKVYSVAFDREGWRLLSGSADGTIKIWETESEQDCLTLRGHDSHVFSVAFSPDGKRLASGGYDLTIRVWDVESGLEVFTLFGHSAREAKVAFSPDGRLLAAASGARGIHGSIYPGRITIWDAATGRELRTLGNHPGSVNSLVFCGDGRLASAEEDGTVRLYDPLTGQLLIDLKAHEKSVRDVVFSPDDKLLATCSGSGEPGKILSGEVKIWDASTLQETAKPAVLPSLIHHLAFSHDSRLLAGAGADQNIHIWDAATLQEKAVLRGHNKQVYRVAFSSDDLRIVSASLDHTFKVWDTVTGMEMLNFPAHAVAVLGLAFSSDGVRLATSGYDYLIKLWDAVPRTQESIDQREALSLVTFQFAKGLSSEEVKARIRTDAAISEAVRRRALALVEPYGRNLRHQAIIALARKVVTDGLPEQDVLNEIRNDKIIQEHLKSDVLRFVEDTGYLHWCSRAVVSVSDLAPSEYRLALRQAEAACRSEPANTVYLTTFGMAQYRLGMFEEGLNTLTRAARSDNSTTLDPGNLAAQAMAHFRLGQKNEAMNRLDQLRGLLNAPNAVESREARDLLREATKLIEQTK
jgi:WD40 repeat protein